MFKINNIQIIEDVETMLLELRRQLLLNDKDLFRSIKSSGDNIMVTCPYHKGGHENTPSFGIYKADLLCHCFTCQWKGYLDEVISNVFGYDDFGKFGKQWILKNFHGIAIEYRTPLVTNFRRDKQTAKETVIGFTEEELDNYRYTHPYMYQRGLTDEIIEIFDIGFDKNTGCLTFPVYNIDKTPVFIARRSVSYKFFNYPKGVEKPVYCAERFTTGLYRQAVICESILDALTCWRYGIPAVALIGTGTKAQYKVLQQLPVKKYIIGMDPDKAGDKAASELYNHLKDYKLLTRYEIPQGEDISSLDSKVLNLVEVF